MSASGSAQPSAENFWKAWISQQAEVKTSPQKSCKNISGLEIAGPELTTLLKILLTLTLTQGIGYKKKKKQETQNYSTHYGSLMLHKHSNLMIFPSCLLLR